MSALPYICEEPVEKRQPIGDLAVMDGMDQGAFAPVGTDKVKVWCTIDGHSKIQLHFILQYVHFHCTYSVLPKKVLNHLR